MREPCGDLGQSTEGGGNSHCKSPRTGALLVHSRVCEDTSVAGREGTVAQLRSKRSTLNADQQLCGTCHAPRPFLQGRWLRTDHSPPKAIYSPSCYAGGSRRDGKAAQGGPAGQGQSQGRSPALSLTTWLNHQARPKGAELRVRVEVGVEDGSQLGTYSPSKAGAHEAVRL